MAQQIKIGKAVLELATDQSGVISGLKVVEAEFEKKSKSISARSVAMGAAIGTALGTVAVAAAKKLVFELKEIALRGVELAPVVTSFENLSTSIGQSSQAMLQASRTGAKGLITDLDLMAAANKAMLLGLPVTNQSLNTMAEASVALGKAMNQGATKSFDDLITALGRSSPMILDNLGLSVKVGEANEKYAASIGKTTSQLTDAEKKTAFYNAAMEAARKKVDEVGGIQLTLKDRLEQSKVWMTNFTDSLGVAIATSPVLAAGLGELATSLSAAFGSDTSQMVTTLMGYVNQFAIGLVSAGQAGVTAAGIIVRAWEGLKLIFAIVSQSAALVVEGIVKGFGLIVTAASKLPGVGGQFKGLEASMRDASAQAEGMRTSFGDQAREALEGVKGNSELGKTIDVMGTTLGDVKAKMAEASKAQAVLSGVTRDAAAAAEADAEAQAKATKEAIAASKAATDLRLAYERKYQTVSVMSRSIRILNADLAEYTAVSWKWVQQRSQPFIDQTRILRDKMVGLDDIVKDLPGHIDKIDPPPDYVDEWAEFKNFTSTQLGLVGDAARGVFAQMILHTKGFKDGAEEIFRSMVSAVKNILTGLLSDFTDRVLKGMINAITGAEGGFSSAFRGLFGRSITAAQPALNASATASGTSAGAAWGAAWYAAGYAAVAAGAYILFKKLEDWLPGGGSYTTTPAEVEDYRRKHPDNPYGRPGDPNYDPGNPDESRAPDMPSGSDDFATEGPPRIPGYGGFAMGTPRLDYMAFRRRGQDAVLHGNEAVVPQGGGHRLASEIASALGGLMPAPVIVHQDLRGAVIPDRLSMYRLAQQLLPGMSRAAKFQGKRS